MFFAIDESKQHGKKVFGGILLPKDDLPAFEGDFVSLRLKHKLFGELGWTSIDQYYERYKDFIDLFFNRPQCTYHSICYRREEQKYNAAYTLLRTITWKLCNANLSKGLFVVFDNDSYIGEQGTEKIKECANRDIKFKVSLEFCNQGASHVLGVLQIVDILTGALCSVVNKKVSHPQKQIIIDYIMKKNNYIPLNWSSVGLPKLTDYKIHYFDPDDRPVK